MTYLVWNSWTDMDGGYFEQTREFTAKGDRDALDLWKKHYQGGKESTLVSKDTEEGRVVAQSYNGEIEYRGNHVGRS